MSDAHRVPVEPPRPAVTTFTEVPKTPRKPAEEKPEGERRSLPRHSEKE